MAIEGGAAPAGEGVREESLAAKARAGLLWNTGMSLVRDALQFGLMVVLARLLTPKDYGQFGLVTSVTTFLIVFSFRPFLGHTLQAGRNETVDYDLHFTAGAFIQTGLFLLTAGLATALLWWPAYAEVSPLLGLKALTFLLDWPSELRVKMLERELNWKRLRLLHTAGLVASGAVSVGMAAAGAGVWSLVAPPLLVHLPFAWDLFVVERWRPRWSWRWEDYRPAWRFGLSRAASGVVTGGRTLLESSLLVHILGYAGFGIYGRATGLAQMVALRFVFLFMQSLYPLIPRLDAAAGERTAAAIIRSVAWVVMPAGAVLAALADPAVRYLYGSKWLEAIPLVPWAVAAAAAGSVAYAAYMLLLASHGQKQCLLVDVLVLGGTAAALLWAAPLGLASYIKTLAAVQVGGMALLLAWLNRRGVLLGSDVMAGIGQAVFAAALAWAVCDRGWRWLGADTVGLAAAVAYGAIYGVLYVATVRALFPRSLDEIVRYAPAGNRIARLLMLGERRGVHHGGQESD